MSQSFQRFDDCFLLIAASSAERQKSRLQLLCRTLDSLDRRLSSGLLDDSCCRQCFAKAIVNQFNTTVTAGYKLHDTTVLSTTSNNVRWL